MHLMVGSSSWNRSTPGADGFFTLIHDFDGPDRQGCSLCFETIAEPPRCLGIVLRDTTTGGVHRSDPDLRISVALVGGLAEPLRRLGIVLQDAPATGVNPPVTDHEIAVAAL